MPRWLKRRQARQIAVTTVHGGVIVGILDQVTRDGVVVRAARVTDPGAETVSADGLLFVPKAQVHYYQSPEE